MSVPKQEDVIQELINKTLRELSAPPIVSQKSRVWKSPVGYRYLVQWSNAVLLRYFIRLFTQSLPKSEYRRKAQVDDAGRSTVRNIEEGYKRSTTSEYLEFLGFTQGSLEEVKGDTREMTEDGFLKSKYGTNLKGIGIDLGDFNRALRPRKPEVKEVRGTYRKLEDGKPESDIFLYHPLTVLYPPLSKIRAEDLTYEIFMELINKTDFLLRKLVISLETKLISDNKNYKIEQARIKQRFMKPLK